MAIEDADAFAAVFGPDAPLAWDAERGEVVHAYLAPAVRAFFRNGGTRCWVVRVAGVTSTNVFPIPGLARAIGGTITPAFARATSPGSWSDGLRVGCTASVQPVGVGAARADGEVVAVDALVTAGTLLVPGDILRLHTASHLGFLPVDAVADGPVSSPPSDRLSRTVIGRPVWFRTTPPALSSPAIATATVFTARREPDGIRSVFALQAPVVSWMADTDGATVRLDLRIDVADAPQSGALLSVAFGSQELWLTVHDVGVRADSAGSRG